MASPGRSILPRLEPAASPQQQATLTDDLLQDIFLRICPADLVRASAACVAFHHLIFADPTFLRRYRATHPPLLLGFLGVGIEGFQPVEAPHPNAPAARALHSAADFSFDFLPRREGLEWVICDVRDGRVLLDDSNPFHRSDDDNIVLGDLAVCDPLSRQYLLLPRIPKDLLASVQIKETHIDDFRASLVPSGDWEETSFRVLCMIHSGDWLMVCVFSSTSGCWNVGASTSWDALSLPPRKLESGWAGRWPEFAYGCWYWKLSDEHELLKLEMNTLEFSIVDLPPDQYMCPMWDVAIVESGEGILGMFSMIYDLQVRDIFMVYYTFQQNGNERANEWDLKNTTPMPGYCCGFVRSAGGYIFLPREPVGDSVLHPQCDCSSFEIKTSNIERVRSVRSRFCFPYFGFQPSISPRRRIQGYEVRNNMVWHDALGGTWLIWRTHSRSKLDARAPVQCSRAKLVACSAQVGAAAAI